MSFRGGPLVFTLNCDVHRWIWVGRDSLCVAVMCIGGLVIIDVEAVPIDECQQLLVSLLQLHAAIQDRVVLVCLLLCNVELLLEGVVHVCDCV